ncbi:MAG: J domain-containing protein [bacterium]|jgi:hypothetical protein|nr:J domain-containing protein [Betaproteobacteria bacterium]
MNDSPTRPKTHYEILKVEADVSADDLRAAYRILSRRYHPDRHPKHPDAAARIMASINVAYDVLSDPERRSRYDREIGVGAPRAPMRPWPRPRAVRHPYMAQGGRGSDAATTFGAAGALSIDAALRRRATAVRRLMALSLLSCMAGVLVILWVLFAPAEAQDEPDLARIIDARVQRAAPPGGARDGIGSAGPAARTAAEGPDAVHIRPLESPMGLPWPSASGELPGYARNFADGELGLLLDNRLGPSDVFAKVYRVSDDGLVPGRHVFVRARERLLLAAFPSGEYEVHYLSLDTGQTLRSVPLLLATPAPGGLPLEYRLDDMQGRSGRAKPIPQEVFDSPAVILKLTRQLPARPASATP